MYNLKNSILRFAPFLFNHYFFSVKFKYKDNAINLNVYGVVSVPFYKPKAGLASDFMFYITYILNNMLMEEFDTYLTPSEIQDNLTIELFNKI